MFKKFLFLFLLLSFSLGVVQTEASISASVTPESFETEEISENIIPEPEDASSDESTSEANQIFFNAVIFSLGVIAGGNAVKHIIGGVLP